MDTLHTTLNAAQGGLGKVLDWVDHNRGLAVALAAGIAVSAALVSCAPKTQSILNPEKKVTAAELQREVAQVQADYKAKTDAAALAQQDLRQQYDLRAKIVGIAGGLGQLATTGALDPAGAIGSVLQLCTLFGAAGLVYDNRRKDKIIAGGASDGPAAADASTTAAPGA